MLDKLFGSRVRVKLLKLFFHDPSNQYYVREITRLTNERINSVRRELNNLLKMDLILEVDYKAPKKQEQEKGAELRKYYAVNTDAMLYTELKQLITKAELVGDKSIFEKLAKSPRVQIMYLYGLFVGDEEAPVDVFIVGSVSKKAINDCMNKLQKNSGKAAKFTVMETEEYKFRNEITDRFLVDLLSREKIVILDKLSKKIQDDYEQD